VSATTPEIVLDASAAVTGLLGNEGSASAVVESVASGVTSAHVPDLFVAEVTNAIVVRVNVTRWPIERALRALEVVLAWPLAIQSCLPLAPTALESAASLGISGYDSFYAALSARLDVPLVTADRKLAAAVPGAVLVT
jgi:predicted nucleic acid-binding protein